MSKQETGGAQSLEEILASIRKSLDDEPTKGLSKLSKPPATLAPEVRTPAEPPTDGLSSRLAGALSGAATSLDGALADVFAHRPQKDPPAAAAPATPSTKPVEAKDPMWFLTRPGVADDGAADKGEAAPSRGTDITSPTGSVEEFKLSRPETLRPSLPPLFAADGSLPPAAAPAAAPAVVKAAAARAEKGAEQAVPTVPPERDRPDPSLRSAAAPQPAPAAPRTATASQSEPAPAAPRSATASQPAAAAQVTEASSAAQGPPLEEMIAQLLEPVLVRWLDSNLPRMIETVVRAEVDRALARGR